MTDYLVAVGEFYVISLLLIDSALMAGAEFHFLLACT